MAIPIKPVPSLSSKGYLRSITEKLDSLLAHFHASDINQDHIHHGTISNLAAIVKEAGHDIPKFKSELRRVLEQYLGRNFDMAVVEVDDDTDVNDSNRVNVTYSAMVSQAGQRYDLAHQLSLVNGKFEKITKLNNTGSHR
jgi:hypothetical protein